MDAPRELTEWEEMQIRMGNMPAPAPTSSRNPASEWAQAAEEKEREKERKEKVGRLIDKHFDELEELDDEAALKHFRDKRLFEMQQKIAREKYGELIHCSEDNYKLEVTDMTGVPVVVLLWNEGNTLCELIGPMFTRIAKRFKSTKFVKIRADAAIRNYPEKNLPTLLVYYNGDIIGQVVGLSTLGGESVTEKDIEWALKGMKSIEGSELEENPRLKNKREKEKQREKERERRKGQWDPEEEEDPISDDD